MYKLLAAIYEQLAGPDGCIDEDWMAHRIRRLDDIEGDIDTLMTRIAFVRTWTYVTHREDWVPNPEHWQEVTRQIEDRHSDALHARLTARFVESTREGPRHGPSRRRSRRVARVVPLDPSTVADSPFATLLGLAVPDAAGEEHPDEQARARWVQGLVDADFDAFGVDDDGALIYEGQPVGRLERGAELLHPTVSLHGLEDVAAGARRRIERRLQAWARDLVENLVAPLRRLEDEPVGSELRGLLYQLIQGLGTITRDEASAQLQALGPEDRERLDAAGVELGRSAIHVPVMATGRAMKWRAALLRAWVGPRRLTVPEPGTVSVEARDGMSARDYLCLGFVLIAGRAVRADQLERAHTALHALGTEPFELPPELGAWLGCRRRRLPTVLRAMGYRSVQDDRWAPVRRGRSRRRKRQRAPSSS